MLDESLDISSAGVRIRENINISAKENLGCHGFLTRAQN